MAVVDGVAFRDQEAAEDAREQTTEGATVSAAIHVNDGDLAVRRAPQLRQPAALPGWLLTIVRSAALDLSCKVRRGPRPADEVREAVDHREPEICDAIEAAEAFARLPTCMQRTLEQHARGLRVEEIAAAEGITRSAARTRLSRARSRLRSSVGP